MNKNPITDGFGRIEEGLDRLEHIAQMNGVAELERESSFEHSWTVLLRELKDQLTGLEDVVLERVVRNKSVSATDLLQKVVRRAIREFDAFEMSVAFVIAGEGRVSMELVELSMSSLLACLKVAVASFQEQSSVKRMMKNLFPTCSLQMELHATGSEIKFVLLTDGDPFKFGKTGSGAAAVRSVRENVARHGGWFSFSPLSRYGGKIEFRIPVSKSRRPAVVLRTGSTEALMPSVCVSEEISDVEASLAARDLPWYRLSPESGLVPIPPAERHDLSGSRGVVAGVADFQLLILADEICHVEQMREINDPDLLESESWFSSFGTFQQGNQMKVGPLVDGHVLISAWRKNGAKE